MILPSAQEVDRHVGIRLRTERLQRSLTQEELGYRIGVSYQQIQKYETGANRISASTLVRLALVLEIEPQDFFSGRDMVPPPGRLPHADRKASNTVTAVDDEVIEAFAHLKPQVRERLGTLIIALSGSSADKIARSLENLKTAIGRSARKTRKPSTTRVHSISESAPAYREEQETMSDDPA